MRDPLAALMHAIDLRTAGFNPLISVTEYHGPTTPRTTREYSIEEFGREVLMVKKE